METVNIKSNELLLGIDIGGTYIKIAAFDNKLTKVAQGSLPTQSFLDGKLMMQKWQEGIKGFIASLPKPICGAGIGIPGMMNETHDIAVQLPNLKVLQGVHVKEFFSDLLQVPVVIENDVNAFAWGEYLKFWPQANTMLAVVMGTGIGGGIVLDGHIFSGQGSAGEFGHVPIMIDGLPCICGSKGCWEQYASSKSLIRFVVQKLENLSAQGSHLPVLWQNKSQNEIDGRSISNAAQQGDAIALEAFQDLGYHLGLGIAGLLNIFHPDVVVVGGGILPTWDFFEKSLNQAVKERTLWSITPTVKIVPAQSGNLGSLGCALLCVDKHGNLVI